MDSPSAFIYGRMTRNDPPRVFDWVKAAQLIRDRFLSGNLEVASAGLRDDWEYTGGKIFENGSPIPEEDTYTYLSSTWAIPELSLDGDIFECWVWKKDFPDWNSGTYWPEEALQVLNSSFARKSE
jgi:hypothetical protein